MILKDSAVFVIKTIAVSRLKILYSSKAPLIYFNHSLPFLKSLVYPFDGRFAILKWLLIYFKKKLPLIFEEENKDVLSVHPSVHSHILLW